MANKEAVYSCRRCQHVWREVPALKARNKQTGADPCPNCGHLYAKWLNYEVSFARGGR